MSKRIGVLVGSLRKESLNLKMAKELIRIAPSSLQMQIIDIRELPFYNEDDEKTPSEAVKNFRREVKNCDGFLFLTPEYNRSIPAVLKNAIDVGSRPMDKNVWNAKPGAVVSVSPGAVGGFGANHHLRQAFVFLNIFPLQQPEVYIGKAHTLFDAKGHMTDKDTLQFLKKFLDAFADWVEKH